MTRCQVCAVSIVVLLVAAAAQASDKKSVDSLLAADAGWMKAFSAKDLAQSVAYFEENGSMLGPNAPIVTGGDTTISRDPMPIILGMSQASVTSDANGLATMQPSTGGFQGALAILGAVMAGSGSLPFQLQSLWPPSN